MTSSAHQRLVSARIWTIERATPTAAGADPTIMRLLILTQYYWPEVGAPQARLLFQTAFLRSRGHDVDVLTTRPSYPSGVVPPEYSRRLFGVGRQHGGDVVRVWSYASPNRSFLRRLMGYLTFAAVALPVAAWRGWRKRYDIIFVEVPPVFLGMTALVASAFARARVVCHVADLWVDMLKALGLVRRRALLSAVTRIETAMYRRCARLITVTDGFREALVTKGIPPHCVSVLHNGADTDEFTPPPDREARERSRHALDLDGAFVAIYAGNHGLTHGLETLVQAAAAADDGIRWIFIGDGIEKPHLIRLARQLGLAEERCRFLDPMSHERLLPYLWAADVGLACWRDMALIESALSVKVPMYLACSLPVVFSGRGITQEVVERAGAGICVAPARPDLVLGALDQLRADGRRRQTLGTNGREYAALRLSRRVQASELERIFIDTVQNR